MRVLVLAWEFPPRLIGGIARHVAELYPEIVKLGHEIHLLTVEFKDTPQYEVVEGIHLYRLAVEENSDFFEWVTNMNLVMQKQGEKLSQQLQFDLIHAHDWLVGDAAIALKHQFKTPLVSTIHATENGRNNGIHKSGQKYIDDKEKNLVYNSWRVIVCSQYMRYEVESTLNSPWNKIDVVYNGIRPEKKNHAADFDRREFRRRFAHDDEFIIYYVGRIAYEKGIFVLLNSAPQILEALSGKVKVVVIGGGNTDSLKQQAKDLGIWNQCYFTGFMADQDLDKFQTIADCAVFPSLYEPFGIVALESFAARVPVVVSDAGGLSEVVQHQKTGIVTYANNPESLAWGVLAILKNPEQSQTLVKNAYASLANHFSWSSLAQQTEAIYGRVIRERSLVKWQ